MRLFLHKAFIFLFFSSILFSVSPLLAQKSEITKKNNKRTGVQLKSTKIKQAGGNENLEKRYNIQSPKPYSKKNVIKVDVSKEKRRSKASEIKSNSGDRLAKPKEEYINLGQESKPISNKDNLSQKEYKNNQDMTKSTGDLNAKDRDSEYNYNTKRVPDKQHVVDVAARKAAERQKSVEAAASSGDVDGSIFKDKKAREQNISKSSGAYRGRMDYDLVADRKERLRKTNREISSNQGDRVGEWESKRKTEKEKSVAAAGYKGRVNANTLEERKELAKSKSKEMSSSTGDNTTLAARKARMKENQEKVKTHTGDILVSSLEARKNNMRNKSKKMSSYQGEILVKRRSKGNHPSAVYAGGKLKGSIAEKERYRKKMVKKFRRRRDAEDPQYMRKEAPKPRYESKEYEIWESKTRDGDGPGPRIDRRDDSSNEESTEKQDKPDKKEKKSKGTPAKEDPVRSDEDKKE